MSGSPADPADSANHLVPAGDHLPPAGDHLTPAGPHTAAMWDNTADIRARIAELPFLTGLADGSLDPEAFAFYIAQDTHYISAYQRAMLQLASRAPSMEDMRFWAKSTVGAIAEEKAMHEALTSDERIGRFEYAGMAKAVTTHAYGGFLISQAVTAPYAAAAAAQLPCYWIFADAGRRMHELMTAAPVRTAGGAGAAPPADAEPSADAAAGGEHPFRSWVNAYADPVFQTLTGRAIRIVERACENASKAEREQAVESFRQATRLEELFWRAPMAKDRPLV